MEELNRSLDHDGDEPRVSPRDAEVVQVIEDEGLSDFTFDGLRRITGAHPETLSRSLGRLEEDGVVVRSPGGYSVTGKAKGAFPRPMNDGTKKVPLLHTFLPYDASAATIVSALKGRWFDTMRWVGMAESEEGLVLKWVTEDGAAVIDARLAGGQLDVEARLSTDSDLPKAVRAAHQLMGRIAKLYSSPRPGAKTALLRIGHFTPYAM